jgi:ribose transport system permease protein
MSGRLYWLIQLRRNDGLGGLYVVLAAFAVLYCFLFPGILQPAALNKFVQGWFPTAMVAAAETIVMLTGGIDLAVGPMVSLGSVVAASTMQGPLGMLGGVLAVLALGACVGTLVGWFVAVARYPAIIVTLAMSFVIRGVALLLLPRPGGFVPPALSDALAGLRPTTAGLLVLLVLGWKLYQATPLGIGLIAVGDNAEGAYRSGVGVVAARLLAYALSGVLQALTGLYVAAQTGSGDPLIGEPLTLSAIAAAVLGGVGFLGGQGTLRGALAGSLLMSILINVMFFMSLPLVAQYVVQGLIIVVTVALPRLRGRAWSAPHSAPGSTT